MLEKDSSHHAYTEEKEELHRSLVTLSKDREELQEMVELLRQEKQQLRTELDDRMEMVKPRDQCRVSRLSCVTIYSLYSELKVGVKNPQTGQSNCVAPW